LSGGGGSNRYLGKDTKGTPWTMSRRDLCLIFLSGQRGGRDRCEPRNKKKERTIGLVRRPRKRRPDKRMPRTRYYRRKKNSSLHDIGFICCVSVDTTFTDEFFCEVEDALSAQWQHLPRVERPRPGSISGLCKAGVCARELAP
jgi:hypothetical protein